MGCVSSTNSGKDSKEQGKKNAQIEKDLRKKASNHILEIKLLLLGTGESGKSTIAKQMKIIHQNGYTQDELLTFRPIIYQNVFAFLEQITSRAKTLGITGSEIVEKASNYIAEMSDSTFEGSLLFDTKFWDSAEAIWSDENYARLCEDDTEISSINQSTRDFFKDIQRIRDPNYLPTSEDILLSRSKTTGIVESRFQFKNYKFIMIDVGGQRSERRKWIHCFDNVTALIFVTSLSEYNQTLVECSATNRMSESLRLFASTCNSHWFKCATIIMFLNKRDLFEQKIKRIPLTTCFPEYVGGNNFDQASEYIRHKFEECNKDSKREIYSYLTCATSTDGISSVFNIISDTIIKNSLREYGLY